MELALRFDCRRPVDRETRCRAKGISTRLQSEETAQSLLLSAGVVKQWL